MTVPGDALAGPSIPQRLTDRWRHRKEPDGGNGLVYWHVLVDQAPEIRNAVLATQRVLRGFPGMHCPPARWLHMTVMTVCPVRQLSRVRAAALLAAAQARLSRLAPVAIEAEQILFHPEAVALRVRPARALAPVADAVSEATAETIEGWNPHEHLPDRWIPHVTIAYCTVDQAAAPIVAAAGQRVPVCRATVSRVSLIEQRGPERSWDWNLAGTAAIGRP
jgi:2'-5' RNA ligase superfamily